MQLNVRYPEHPGHGETIDPGLFHQMLDTAYAHGWQPTGTLKLKVAGTALQADPADLGEWPDGYRGTFRRLTADDAAEIAAALARTDDLIARSYASLFTRGAIDLT